HLAHRVLDDRFEQAVLAVVVMIERAARDLRLRHQFLPAHAGKTPRGEQLAADLLESLAGRFGLACFFYIHTVCIRSVERGFNPWMRWSAMRRFLSANAW